MFDVLEEIGIEENISGLGDSGFGDEIGFLGLGKVVKGIGKGLGKAAKAVGKAAKTVVRSPITQAGVGVLAVAFPAVGIPAAAAVATANVAITQVEKGQKTAKALNKGLASLKGKAKKGDKQAAVAVNAMQLALANRAAARSGLPRPRPVVQPGVSNFSIRPKIVPPVPTSLYAPTPKPEQLALKLAAGGSALGRQLLTAVKAGKPVEVPSGVVVVPGKRPVKGKKVWIGKPPAGVRATKVAGAHVVTKGGFTLSGQTVYQSA